VPNGLWYAIVLALAGLLMITQIWNGLTRDRIGVLAAFLDAFALAGYVLIGDHLSKTKSSGAISVWGFGFAAVGLMIFFPIWDYPVEALQKDMNLLGVFDGYTLPGWLLVLWIVVMGTIAPYLFVLAGLKILSASTASVFGMIEPVLAGMIAWWWLSESLNGIQLIGCVVVIVGIAIADRARQHAATN
jgi:drug/metabolite transporter (DMT)-like permease